MEKFQSIEVSLRLQTAVRNIAVVGASDKTHRPVFGVMQFLQRKGYRCLPVNPRLKGQVVLGETVFGALNEIPQTIDMVDIFRRSDEVLPVVQNAVHLGAKSIWMQLGVINIEAAKLAYDAGLDVVMNRCPAIDWR
ncbi:MAG: CoA-binding protein [Myxococcota bacterium]|nr:CoA-binding protein [Myxococcota bacterium]